MSKHDDWYDKQSPEKIFLIAVSPLIIFALVIIVVSIIRG